MTTSTPLPSPSTACDRDPWRSHPARIVRITDEIPGVRTYDVAFEEPAVREACRFVPGQFNMLHLPGIGEAAISISSDRRVSATLSHTVRAVGNMTTAMSRLVEGDSILVRGPFGTPWPLDRVADAAGGSGGAAEPRPSELVFVAGGLGLASQRSAILEMAHDRGRFSRVVVLHGAKTPGGLLYAREYDAWRAAGIEVELVVDDPGGSEPGGWQGATGTVLTLLERLPLDAARATILCCGPDAMMAAVGRLAVARGVAAARVFLSLERNMACAVGHCGLCQFGPEFVCKDGPVFPYDRIARYLAVPRL